MNIDWNKKYNTIAVYVFLVIASVILFYLGISKFSDFVDWINGGLVILQPFIVGFIIAYLINFMLRFYEKKMHDIKKLNKLNKKTIRTFSMILSYVTGIIIIALFIQFVVPQFIDSIVRLANNIPTYFSNISVEFERVVENINIDHQYVNKITSTINNFAEEISKAVIGFIPVVGTYAAKIASSLWNIVLGIIISVYMLVDKEKYAALSRKITYALFSKERAKRILALASRSNDTFGKFFVGKIIDSLIIGVLTFFVLIIFNMPYAILVSVIIGITNIIPFFGPFIGAIPSFVIILCISPSKALIFLVIIFVIQQLDGNLIGPKILGNTIGISAFWILFAILVAGKLMGLLGMIIGVPVFAVIYTIIKENVERKLNKKGLNPDTVSYMDK